MGSRQSIEPKELAAVSGKSYRTITRWCKLGKIEAFQVEDKCSWIIPLRTLPHIWKFKLDPEVFDVSVIVKPSRG